MTIWQRAAHGPKNPVDQDIFNPITIRVGEGIVSAIGSCENYRIALADPLLITRQVLKTGLDSQTAYAIVSIDIADIDVGANIGARLRIDQAEADFARAEELARTLAVRIATRRSTERSQKFAPKDPGVN